MNLYNSLKLQPKYRQKPKGITKFIEMYNDAAKMEKFLGAEPDELANSDDAEPFYRA
jgi:hypothetical protein